MPALPRRRSPLDRAILASLLAMLAMNVVVLSQQLQPGPSLAATASEVAQA